LGFFATYAGFLYNDMFSVGLRLFETRWKRDGDMGAYVPNYDIRNAGGPGPYPFGLDWMWVGADNELLYVNSLKMKLSVCMGVSQMILGLLLRWSNAFFHRNMVDFFCECVPMMCFMLCFFGWMDFMILYKWTHPIEELNGPPSIINSLICMSMGKPDLQPIYQGSVELSKTLMLFALLSAPVILIPKPIILLMQHKAKMKKKMQEGGDNEGALEECGDHGGHGGHGDEFAADEVFIHQMIETIEYVLGTVSHTASYLRIWALSLAHQQLSMVFFQKTLSMGLVMPFPVNGIVLYFLFILWFGITIGVLLGMDVMECFLHTLRLHWVEFQSKFYNPGGIGGVPFWPFDINKHILAHS